MSNIKDEQKSFIKRYYILVYGIVLTASIILFLFALREVNEISQSTLLNLSTELFGVVVVFFIVQFVFKVNDFDTNKRIEKLLQRLEASETAKSDNFFHPQPDMDNFIENSMDTKISGVTLTVCVDKGMGALRSSLKNGGIIKLILIDGSDESFKACAARSESNSVSYFKKKHATTMDNIDYLLRFCESQEVKGSLQVRRINYPPTTGIEVYKNRFKEMIKVEIYPQHTGWDKPPIFTLNSNDDKNWFGYFENQFDAIWERGESYKLDNKN